MTDLVAFIEARLAEDEQIARAATDGPWRIDSPVYAESITAADGSQVVAGGRWGGEASVFDTTEDAVHIARHDPARVLRQVAAKRRVLERHRPVLLRKGSGADYYVTALVCETCGGSDASFEDGTPAPRAARHPCPTLLDLASVWSDHPDYDEGWRP